MPKGFVTINKHKQFTKWADNRVKELQNRIESIDQDKMALINENERLNKHLQETRMTVKLQSKELESRTCTISAQLEFIEHLERLVITSLSDTYKLREHNASRNLEPRTDTNR